MSPFPADAPGHRGHVHAGNRTRPFPRKAKRECLFSTMVGGTRQSPLEAVSRITDIA